MDRETVRSAIQRAYTAGWNAAMGSPDDDFSVEGAADAILALATTRDEVELSEALDNIDALSSELSHSRQRNGELIAERDAMRAVVEAARNLRDDLRLRAQVAGTDKVECGAGVWNDINAALAAMEQTNG